MATAVLFIGWNRPHVGAEEKAYAYLTNEGMKYLHGLQGKYFERLEVIALTAHGGDLNGAVILFGERPKLDELRRTDEFEAFAINMGMHFDRLGVVPGVNLEGIQAVMKRRGM
ncbi:MAG TPA: hypothetical protein VF989_16690 [Polyangiaceae bacterium]|jgi:hypothetical protein